MNRALLWLLGGLALLVLAVFAVAPELLGDLEAMGGTLAIALGATIPAALLAVLFVSTRRRRRDDPPSDPGA